MTSKDSERNGFNKAVCLAIMLCAILAGCGGRESIPVHSVAADTAVTRIWMRKYESILRAVSPSCVSFDSSLYLIRGRDTSVQFTSSEKQGACEVTLSRTEIEWIYRRDAFRDAPVLPIRAEYQAEDSLKIKQISAIADTSQLALERIIGADPGVTIFTYLMRGYSSRALDPYKNFWFQDGKLAQITGGY